MSTSVKTSDVLPLIYRTEDGLTEVDLLTDRETMWLTQAQMAALFDRNVQTINGHVGNVFEDVELEQEATVRNFRIVQTEGSREVTRDIAHYNLDVVVSVGYQVKSKGGTQFRQG